MLKSKNKKVQDFLDEISIIDNEKHIILNTMREIVFENYQTTDERMMYGGIMFSIDNDDFGGLFVRKIIYLSNLSKVF